MGKRLLDDLIGSGLSNVKLLDGDQLRQQLEESGKRYGYSTADRNALMMEYADIAMALNKDGYTCILCAIAHVRRTREEVRQRIGNYMEVYLDCPVEACAARDQKGQYAKAFDGLYDNFIGVTEPYQRSEHVELKLDTARSSIEECSSILLHEALSFLRKEERTRTSRPRGLFNR